MRIACISASNIKHAGQNSTSLKTCHLIKKMAKSKTLAPVETDILPLVNYELKPCIGCGACIKQDKCIHDPDFNQVYDILKKVDALFIVSAHYAPIPSKLCMLLEKIEQLAFVKRFRDENYRSPLYKKPVGIVGHGGGTEEIISYYTGPVIDSIWNALSYPIEMDIIDLSDQQHGVVFPVKCVRKDEKSVFPIQEYDWVDIERRLDPLVDGVLHKIVANE